MVRNMLNHKWEPKERDDDAIGKAENVMSKFAPSTTPREITVGTEP